MTQLKFHLRPFSYTDSDYEAIIAIDQQAWPGEPLSKEVLQHEDQAWDPKHFFARVMVEVGDTLVAYAQYSETPWAYEPDKYFIKMMVIPDYQGQGIGTTLYEQISSQLTARDAKLFTATTREDQPRAIQFLTKRGFRRVIRELESRLDVQAFDKSAFQAVLDRVAKEGIVITTIRELQAADPNWMRKWWELNWTVVPDMPTSETFTRGTLTQFEESLTSPNHNLDGAFVAIDRATNQWVGLSSVLVYPEDPGTLYVGNTGVVRAYRRRGIALALKVHTIEFAKAYGADVIIGENEENNPMYVLNEKLGFRHSHAWLGFEKALA